MSKLPNAAETDVFSKPANRNLLAKSSKDGTRPEKGRVLGAAIAPKRQSTSRERNRPFEPACSRTGYRPLLAKPSKDGTRPEKGRFLGAAIAPIRQSDSRKRNRPFETAYS